MKDTIKTPISEAKRKCSVCGKAFAGKRSDSKYCSDACRQKAHYVRTVKILEPPVVQKPQYTFLFGEYRRVLESTGYDGSFLPAVWYFFIRSKIPSVTDINDLCTFVNGYWDNEEDMERIKNTAAFKVFEEQFHRGEFDIGN